ncbi:hypothetical protein DC080_10035 [Ignatzschineria cameli]|nr:hypothetical protein DC080_10035 [Ignatzschineria cameli]
MYLTPFGFICNSFFKIFFNLFLIPQLMAMPPSLPLLIRPLSRISLMPSIIDITGKGFVN